MNQTDILAAEKEKILELAAEKVIPVFHNPDKALDSYYINYEDSVHLSSPLVCYDSSEMDIYMAGIRELFYETEYKDIIPVMAAAYLHTKDRNENQLSGIDLNNYMM